MKYFITILTALMFSSYLNATVCNSKKECQNIKKAYHESNPINLIVLGEDNDMNGIRDDVEVFIKKIFPNSKEKREFALNTAKVYGMVIRASMTENKEDNKKASYELAKLSSCYSDYLTKEDRKDMKKIKLFIFNTKERVEYLDIFQTSLNGTIQKTVKVEFNECIVKEDLL